jgi:hypothetical protein
MTAPATEKPSGQTTAPECSNAHIFGRSCLTNYTYVITVTHELIT